MTITHCVLNALNSKQIAYEIAETDTWEKMASLRKPGCHEQLALMVPLETRDGQKLQAIISANGLLNLDAVSDQVGQPVKAVDDESQAKLLAAKGLENLPAIPEITGFETFIDEQLLEAETLLLESGKKGLLITLSNSSFRKLTADCRHLQASISLFDLPPLPNDRASDPADIYAAIRKYTSLQIKKRLADTLEIPPLPPTAQKILQISANPNAEIDDLVKVIEMDPSLAAQVVGWAASPYYSAPGKVKSIRDAIIRVLGYELVLNLALGLAMGQTLKPLQKGVCSIGLFWRQAIYSALTMEKLHRLLPSEKRGVSGLAYLTGLMNNFGYLILNHVFPSHFRTLCLYKQANRHINPVFIEQHLLGITGEQMTAQVAEAWNLPPQIKNAVRFQQDASYDGPDAVYANLSFISRHLLAGIGIGNLPGQIIPAGLYKKLELNPAEVDQILQQLRESQMEIESMLAGLAA